MSLPNSNVIQSQTGIRPRPTPTDAYLANPVTGQYQSSADPTYVCLQSEAQRAVQLMQAEGAIPSGIPVQIDDEPWILPTLVYGLDGRKLWVVSWTEPNPSDSSSPFQFALIGGKLDFSLKCFPEGYGDWKKSFSGGEVWRVGLQGENTTQSRPGRTYRVG